MYIFMCVCVCMYVCACIYECVSIYVCMYVWMCMDVCMYIYIYVCGCMHYVFMYVCIMYMCVRKYVCHICMYVCGCMYICVHTYIHNTYQMKHKIKYTRGRGQLNYVLTPHKCNERSRCAVFTVLISNGIYDPHPDTSTFYNTVNISSYTASNGINVDERHILCSFVIRS